MEKGDDARVIPRILSIETRHLHAQAAGEARMSGYFFTAGFTATAGYATL